MRIEGMRGKKSGKSRKGGSDSGSKDFQQEPLENSRKDQLKPENPSGLPENLGQVVSWSGCSWG